ncbi:hypothetical protein EMEDMD4_420077 [Sinorhizobium medicae]|uniref:Uncharacterized protein n=1 Tax=Sinorhizobium medicae TaxID=110321 RepID=A0A508WYQ0_9HYPH|nr:hypothetical protein EMEDMD4_420077 [Sinorhizobium medicae]
MCSLMIYLWVPGEPGALRLGMNLVAEAYVSRGRAIANVQVRAPAPLLFTPSAKDRISATVLDISCLPCYGAAL